MGRPETAKAIDEAAADWAARLDGGPLSPSDQATLDQWLAADERRVGALARALAILQRTDRLAALGDAGVSRRQTRVDPSWWASLGWRPAAAIMAAAGLAAALGLGFYMRQGPEEVYASPLGKTRQVALSDGSLLLLNTDSQAKVRLGRTRRSVELVSGEAMFEVAKDARRPFIVAAGATRVRAVGTRFVVQRQTRQVDVTVYEGVTEIVNRPAGVKTLAPARTAAAVNDGGVQIKTLSDEDLEQRLSWREGMIAFDGVTLEQAARQFARYSDQKILIDDPTIAARTVTGLFLATNPEGFARAVATSMDLKTTQTAQGVRLHR